MRLMVVRQSIKPFRSPYQNHKSNIGKQALVVPMLATMAVVVLVMVVVAAVVTVVHRLAAN
jgi:hypothetical protein